MTLDEVEERLNKLPTGPVSETSVPSRAPLDFALHAPDDIRALLKVARAAEQLFGADAPRDYDVRFMALMVELRTALEALSGSEETG